MSELLKILKELRINTKQYVSPDYSNSARVTLTQPRRRLNINVTRDLQNTGYERPST